MSRQYWEELLFAAIADATQISNSTAETIMVPDRNIPSGWWEQGRTLQAKLKGSLSNVVTTPGTLTVRARYGGVGGTLLVASAAVALNVAAQTNSLR